MPGVRTLCVLPQCVDRFVLLEAGHKLLCVREAVCKGGRRERSRVVRQQQAIRWLAGTRTGWVNGAADLEA